MTGTQRSFINALTARNPRALCLAKLALMHACGDGWLRPLGTRLTLWEVLHQIDPSGGISHEEAVEAIDLAILHGRSAPGRLLLAITRSDRGALEFEAPGNGGDQ